jgi:hypothetical protein
MYSSSYGYLQLGDIDTDIFGHYDGTNIYCDADLFRSCVVDFAEYNNELYAATQENADLIGSTNGINWSDVIDYNQAYALWALQLFQGQLYLGYSDGTLAYMDWSGMWHAVLTASDSIISMAATGDVALYFGIGAEAVGLATGNGPGYVCAYTGSGATNATLISGPMGNGVQCLYKTPDALLITPWSGFTSAGCAGGPYSVTNKTFTLTNIGTAPLSWSLGNTSLWLNAAPASGTNLTPGGPAAAVTVSLSTNAWSLTAGVYTAAVWFTNLSDNVAQSRQFTLVVDLPVITAEPTNQTIVVGSTASFAVEATGTQVSFQWQKNGTNLTDGNNISGSATAQLSVVNTTTNDDGWYDVVVTDACGCVTSSVVSLAVGVPPAIVSQPQGLIVACGGTASFGVSVSGTPQLYFQWQQNGTNVTRGTVASGLTNSTLTLSNVTAGDAGGYTVIVTNLWGNVTSSVAVLFPTAFVSASVTVTDNPLWTDTGIPLTNGAAITIVASGSWDMYCPYLGPEYTYGPDGDTNTTYDSDRFFSGANYAALIAYVGNDPYQGHWGDGTFFPTNSGYWNIGSFGQFTNPSVGELWLGVNAYAVSTNNMGYVCGSVTAQITGTGWIVPPPTLQYVAAPPGLNFWATGGTNHNRSSIETFQSGDYYYMWADEAFPGYPVSYSFTVESFPTGPAATNFSVCMFIVPAMATEPNPDFVETNCVFMQLEMANGAANWIFRWKTNAPNSDGQLHAVGAQVLLPNPTPLGQWTLTFSNATSATMTAPNGRSTNFVMGVLANVPDISSVFGDPGVVYLGVDAGQPGFGEMSAVLAAAQVSGIYNSISNNWLVDTTLDPSQWVPVANAACYLVPTNNAWWLNWTLPDWGFALQTNSNLSLSTGWSTNGLPAGMMLGGKRRLLIKPGDLPYLPKLFFRLANP